MTPRAMVRVLFSVKPPHGGVGGAARGRQIPTAIHLGFHVPHPGPPVMPLLSSSFFPETQEVDLGDAGVQRMPICPILFDIY